MTADLIVAIVALTVAVVSLAVALVQAWWLHR